MSLDKETNARYGDQVNKAFESVERNARPVKMPLRRLREKLAEKLVL